MARDRVVVAAAPERVFEVLSDPFAYGHWVVGTRQVLGAEGSWPQPGSSLRYDAGVGPLRVRDQTVVLSAVARARSRERACARAVVLPLAAEACGGPRGARRETRHLERHLLSTIEPRPRIEAASLEEVAQRLEAL